MPDGTLHVQGPDGKHYAFGPSSGVTDEASARAYFQKNGLLPNPQPQTSAQPPMAQMSATDTSNPLANWFKDVRGDLLYGGKETLPGRVATWLNPRGMAAVPGHEFVGGMALGPTHIGEGVATLPQHPVHGAAEIVRGVAQTAALPAAVLAPETTAMAAPRMAAGTAASELSSRLGASPDVSTLIGAGASMAPPWRSGKPQAVLTAGERARYREVIHEGLQRNIAEPAKAKLQQAIAAKGKAADLQAAGDSHPVNQLLNAKTGKDFVSKLRGGTDGENAGPIKDALKELGLDAQFRDKVLADSKEPFNFISAKGPGRNFAGKFQAIMSRPGWAIPGMALGAAAGHVVGAPFIGGGVGAIAGAGLGERLQGLRLAREAKAGLQGMPSPAAAPTAPSAPPSSPAATANELMRLRNPELFGQPAGDAAARAQRIAQILQEAKGSEGGLAERRTASAPAPAPTTPKPTVDTSELVSVGRNLGMRPEEAQARAAEAIAQFPNDQNAAIQYMAGRKAPVAASAPRPVSGGATPAPATADLLRARQMQVAGEGMPARPATAEEQAWTDALANFGVPREAQETPAPKPAGIVNNPEFVSQRQRSNLAKNQRQMVGTASGAAQDTAFFQQAKAELGAKASISEVAKRAQELKAGAVKAVRETKNRPPLIGQRMVGKGPPLERYDEYLDYIRDLERRHERGEALPKNQLSHDEWLQAEAAKRQPWQLTRDEYISRIEKLHQEGPTGGLSRAQHVQMMTSAARTDHQYFVAKALDAGKSVPAEVLKDYPEIDRYRQDLKAGRAERLKALKDSLAEAKAKPLSTRTPDDLLGEMDAMTAKAQQRREASKDPSIRALRPTDSDWMSEEELNHFHELQQEWMRQTREERSPQAARERVAQKRAARLAELREKK